MFFFLAFYMFLLVHPLGLVVLVSVELLPYIIENSFTSLRWKDSKRTHITCTEIAIREKLYKVERE